MTQGTTVDCTTLVPAQATFTAFPSALPAATIARTNARLATAGVSGRQAPAGIHGMAGLAPAGIERTATAGETPGRRPHPRPRGNEVCVNALTRNG